MSAAARMMQAASFIMKSDLRSYYASIDHDVLDRKVSALIT